MLIADLDGLRALGLNLPASLTTGNLTKRWVEYFKAWGPVNGRSVNVIPVTWNPADPTSFDKTCIKATQDNKPFAVLNATGYRRGERRLHHRRQQHVHVLRRLVVLASHQGVGQEPGDDGSAGRGLGGERGQAC